MNQRFNGPVEGGVAARDVVNIHSISCPGRAECPHQDLRESKLQADFYRDTGIWAPTGARHALEALMLEHGFTAHKLKLAWQANSLQWDDTTRRLVTKTFRIEPLAGYFIAAIMVAYLLLACLGIILNPPRGSWQSLIEFISIGSLYSVVLYLAARFLVIPYSIAKRVERITQPAKTQNRFAWLFWPAR